MNAQLDIVAIEVTGAMIMHDHGLVSKTYNRLNTAWKGSTSPSIMCKNYLLLRSLPCLTIM